MDIVHFTPGTLSFDKLPRPEDLASILPLASGKGDIEVSCLFLHPGGVTTVPPGPHSQLILTVNGKAQTTFPTGFGPRILAGMGMLLHPGETCRLQSSHGAVILVVEASKLQADLCGISAPERVAGQQWPILESN
jgi:hypothetical protein